MTKFLSLSLKKKQNKREKRNTVIHQNISHDIIRIMNYIYLRVLKDNLV